MPQDFYDDVGSVENKEFLRYEPAFSIQTIKCYGNKIYIQNIPTRKVQTIACQINGMVAKLTIDSGSEGDCIREDVCKKLGIKILPLQNNDHRIPTQADGFSPLDIIGYAKFKAIRGKVTLHFEGYVARTLNAGILCGAPFMERNRLVQELHNRRIIIDGKQD